MSVSCLQICDDDNIPAGYYDNIDLQCNDEAISSHDPMTAQISSYACIV